MFMRSVGALLLWLIGAGLAAAQGGGGSGPCDRACLIGISDQYFAALVAKDPAQVAVAPQVKYTENGQRLRLGDGFWNSVSGRGTYTLHAADPAAGQIVTFATMREAGVPMVVAVRLRVERRRIAEVEALIAHSENGAKGFEALGTPHPLFSQIVPPAERMSRADLVRVANMYFSGMQLNDGKGQYPFADDCNRIENGGLTTNNPTGGRATQAGPAGAPPVRPDPKTATNYSSMWSCREQFESGLLHFVSRIRDRRYLVVDEERGLAFTFVFFDHDAGASRTFQTPNGRTVTAGPVVPWTWHIAELFRIEKGLIRQVEAILERAPYGMTSGWSTWEDGTSDRIQWQGRQTTR
jgi:hypothetical protein